MLLSNLQQLNAINSLTSTIINEMVNQQAMESCCNRLVDDVTPVSKIIDLFCTHSLNSLQLIESDIKQELDVSLASSYFEKFKLERVESNDYL